MTIGAYLRRCMPCCRVTKILGVHEFLKTVLGRECVAKPKPDPDIYLATARALGVEPQR